jgi:aryl carrier-like protein
MLDSNAILKWAEKYREYESDVHYVNLAKGIPTSILDGDQALGWHMGRWCSPVTFQAWDELMKLLGLENYDDFDEDHARTVFNLVKDEDDEDEVKDK